MNSTSWSIRYAAVDAAVAHQLCATSRILALIRFAEPPPMTLTRPRNDRASRRGSAFDRLPVAKRLGREALCHAVGVWALSGGRLALAVADGLGGHIGGKLASHLAIEIFRAALHRPDPPNLVEVAKEIHVALKTAQEKSPELRNMATTFSAAIIENQQMYFVHCGDTRIALQRGNGIQRLTQDHSEAQRLFSAGKTD